MRGARRAQRLCVLAILTSLAWQGLGCSNKDAVLGVAKPVSGPTVSLDRDVQPILSSHCAVAGCHGAPLGAPMSLLSSDTYTALVGAAACEAPAFKRVEAGSSATSYLLMKLEGTQSAILGGGGCGTCTFVAGTVADCGSRMPLGGPFLADAEIQVIREWIDEGAPNH
jgi:hypothetical protein